MYSAYDLNFKKRLLLKSLNYREMMNAQMKRVVVTTRKVNRTSHIDFETLSSMKKVM